MSDRQGIKNIIKFALVILAVALVSFAITWHRKQILTRNANIAHDRCKQSYQSSLDIVNLLVEPKKAAKNIVSTDAIAKSLEQCAQKAGLPVTTISRIVPSRPRRIPQSDYVESQSRVSLNNVQLKQLCQFLWNIENEVQGLNISDLHIWFEVGNENRWQADIALAGISLVPQKSESLHQTITVILPEDK